jgi:hypothetical protein
MTTAPDHWARLREVLALIARLDSADPPTRRTAEDELEELRRGIDDGPSPGEVFGRRVAQILREEADRLRVSPRSPGSTDG